LQEVERFGDYLGPAVVFGESGGCTQKDILERDLGRPARRLLHD
jgi:hypothetical protein